MSSLPPRPARRRLSRADRRRGDRSCRCWRLVVPRDFGASPCPPYVVALLGKYLCYAILALALDLVWGYCGILSLGHGAFFALGGYAMGMYLMRQIGTRGVYANPILPDFMVFLNWKELPVAWWGFNSFPYAWLMVMLVPGLLAFAFGWFAFRSRVTGVYLSIITQALTYALKLAFFRNDFGFGGNNGLTDFKDILGFNVQADATRAALFSISALALVARAILLAKAIVTLEIRQGADRGARRGEPRALPRLPGRELQAVRLRRLGGDGGHRRRALCAAGRHHQPERIRPRQFDRGGDLGRGRRARHAGRRGARRGRGQFRQDLFHRRLPRILAVRPRRRCSCWSTLFLPKGILGLASPGCAAGAAPSRAAALADGGRRTRRARNDLRDRRSQAHRHAALSRRRQRLLRRLQGAARAVADARARRDARDHRPERRRQDDDDGRHHRQDAARRRRRLFRGAPRPHRDSTRPRSPSSASAANSRSRRCSRTTPSPTTSCSPPRRRAACSPPCSAAPRARRAGDDRPHPRRPPA